MKALVLDGEFDPRPNYAVSEMERRTGIARRGSNVWRHTRPEVKTVPDPEVGPEDVLIDIGRCGVCGSDLHLYETDADGYLIYPSWVKLPVIIGHEFVGKVAAVRAKVTDFEVGDLVTAARLHWCGRCSICRKGCSITAATWDGWALSPPALLLSMWRLKIGTSGTSAH